MFSFLTGWRTAEQDVLSFAVKVEHGFAVAQADALACVKWLGSHAGDIASAVNGLTAVIKELEVIDPAIASKPEIVVAMAAANSAVAALNALVAAGGNADPKSIAAGYVAAKDAWGQVDKARVSLIKK